MQLRHTEEKVVDQILLQVCFKVAKSAAVRAWITTALPVRYKGLSHARLLRGGHPFGTQSQYLAAAPD